MKRAASGEAQLLLGSLAGLPMFVDVSCKKCGSRKRLDLGDPAAGQGLEEHVRLVMDRLSHQPSFGCFGGHFELAPPVPRFWDVHWETLGES